MVRNELPLYSSSILIKLLGVVQMGEYIDEYIRKSKRECRSSDFL